MSETYKVTGPILVIGETQILGAKGFQKREFVIEADSDSKYPQPIKIEALKENCDKLDSVSVGDTVTATFNLRGNEYNGKYYVSLQAWKIEINKSAGDTSPEGAKEPF